MIYHNYTLESEHHEEDSLDTALDAAEYSNLIAGTLGADTTVTQAIDVGLIATQTGRILLVPDTIEKPVNHTISLLLLYFFFAFGQITEEERLAYTLNLIAKIVTDVTIDF